MREVVEAMNLLLLSLAMTPSADEPAFAADLVLVGGKVWTVDRDRPEAEAVAVWHDRILKVGTNTEVKALVGPKTKVIALGGRRVVPGFHDSHVHFLGGGQQLARVELKDAKDEAEFGRRLREFDQKLPKDRWMLGGNWDHDRTFDGKLPTAAIVDKYVQDRPVFIRRYDGHMALANTAALKLAKVTAETKDAGRRRDLPACRTARRRPASCRTTRWAWSTGSSRSRTRPRSPRPSGRRMQHARRERRHQRAGHGRQFGRRRGARCSASCSSWPATGRLTVRLDLRWPIAVHTRRGGPRGRGELRQRLRPHRRGEGVHGRVARVAARRRCSSRTRAAGKNVGVFVTPPETMRER